MQTFHSTSLAKRLLALWEQGRARLLTQPAPCTWFDPRPNRRVHVNCWRPAPPTRLPRSR